MATPNDTFLVISGCRITANLLALPATGKAILVRCDPSQPMGERAEKVIAIPNPGAQLVIPVLKPVIESFGAHLVIVHPSNLTGIAQEISVLEQDES